MGQSEEQLESQWDKMLKIKTTGRDDSHADAFCYPYEPTPYCVLERLANSGLIIGFSLLNCLEFFVFRKMKSSSTINHPLCGCESNVIQKKLPFRVQ